MELKEFGPLVVKRINAFMQDYILNFDDSALKLKDALRYGLLLGGKRSRPLLVYATGLALGQKFEKLDYVAAAVECIHAYSLIHDDMPEMDNDKLRRGKPTVHVRFGQAEALLAGDTLQALAFKFLTDERSGLEDFAVVKLARILASSAGYDGMCGGQALDLCAEHQHLELEDLRLLHSKKTGALIRAAVLMGALSSGNVSSEILDALDRYASLTGLAFQVWDDVLDVIGDTAVMGKPAGSDASLEKSTYPLLLGIDAAKRYAKECADKACSCLDGLDIDTTILRQFASFSVERDH